MGNGDNGKEEGEEESPILPNRNRVFNISPIIPGVIFGEFVEIGLTMGDSQYYLKNLEKTI